MTGDGLPLYPTERQIAQHIMGDRWRAWDGAAVVLERQGLPKPDPLMGGRYLPAVRAFFDRRNGVGDVAPVQATEQMENWDAKRRARA